MALTTTTTRSSVILSEVLADATLKALTPKTVFWNLINHDVHDGPALVKKYTKDADIGAATAATEGVAFTTTTTLSHDTAISATPTEAAVIRSDITTRAMRRKVPGMSANDVYDRIAVGDFSGLMGLLGEEVERLTKALYEKAETDCFALIDDASVTAGSTGVDLSVANTLSAIYSLEAGEPENENLVWCMHPEQTNNLRSALMSTSSASSATWMQQVDASLLNFVPDLPRNGLKGSYLGIPWYQGSPSVNPLPNSGNDVAGALLCLGRGAIGDGDFLRGAHLFVEGHPIKWLFDFDTSARTVFLMGVWEYAAVEHTDAHYISIITDAP